MIQKLSSAFLGLLVMGSMVGCGDGDKTQETPTSSQPIAVKAEVNPAFLEWEKRQSDDSRLKKNDGMQVYTNGYIPPLQKPTVHNPKNDKRVAYRKVHTSSVSSSDIKFDYRDPNLDGDFNDSKLTPIKNQGSCGACWAFASYGALEGTLLQDENISNNFSENNIKNGHGFLLDSCRGGNLGIASAYLARGNGPIFEADDEYNPNSNSSDYISKTSVKYIDNIIKLPVRSSITDNQYLKQAILDHGPIYADINGSESNIYDTSTIYNSEATGSNHAIVLVGWDDEYETEGETGVFIIRNSWGTAYGENGYFYVPYSDRTLAFQEVGYFDDIKDDEAFDFDIIHDTAPNGAITGYTISTSHTAPIYGMSVYDINSSQTIKAVGIFNSGDDTNVTVTLYRDVSIDENSSFNGETTPELFEHIQKGWNTLQLQTPIDINTTYGKFAVKIKIQESGDKNASLPVDGSRVGWSELTTDGNQSFISTNGTNWMDLHTSNNSLAIKVFAQSENNESDVTDTNSSDSNTILQGIVNVVDVNGTQITLPENVKIEFRPSKEDYNNSFVLDVDWTTGTFYDDNVTGDYNGTFPIYLFISNNINEPNNHDASGNIVLFVDDNMSIDKLNEINITMPQIEEIFGLRFVGYDNSGRMSIDGNSLKINNAENTLSYFGVDINSSAREIDANISLFAEVASAEERPNSISLSLGFKNNGNYLRSEIEIKYDSIYIHADIDEYDVEPYRDFNMSDFNVSLPHIYSIELTENNQTKFSIDDVEVYTSATAFNDASDIHNSLFLSGEATAYLHGVTYDSEMGEDEGNGDSGYQQELNEIQNQLDNNSSISQEFRDRKQALINELQTLLDADPLDEPAIQDKFYELINLEDTPPIDDTHVDVNLSSSQIVELFGLEFNATNAVAKIEDDSGRLKITGYNRSSDDATVENIDINFSAKEFNTTLAFTPEADLDSYWPNSIQFQVRVWEDNEYHESNMQIYNDGISISTDDQRYDEFNMTDFNLSELHNYGIKITDDNRTLFIVDGVQVFEANLSVTTPINQIRTGIRFIGKGVASIESFDYSNLFTAPLDSNDLDFISMVNEDIEGIIARLEEFTIPTDLNNSINSLVEEIQTLLGSNPLNFDLINSKKNDLYDYESIVNYMNELNRVRNDVDATANLSQDLNNTLQSLMSDIESQLTVPLNRDTIDAIFNSLNEIDFSFISSREYELNELRDSIITNVNFTDETNSSMSVIIDDINGLLNQYPLDYDAIAIKIEELRSLERELSESVDSGSEDGTADDTSDDNIYGENATIIRGVVTLPVDANLTPISECFDDSDERKPLPSCNAVFIDLFDMDNEFLGSAMVHTDGSYTLYFKELDDVFPVNMKIHTKLNGVEENFYRDFGADHTISSDDSFKSEKDLAWHEDTATGKWVPDVNYLNVPAPETELNLDIASKDSDKYIVSGTVQVPADFILGDLRDDSGEWQGWNMISLTAISRTTGKHYWTELGQTEISSGSHSYPFSFKLPNIADDYIIRLEKMSNMDGASEWIDMYLDDDSVEATLDSDHDFDGDEVLVSSIGVDWQDNGSGIWTPDTNKTGYFTVDASVENIAIDMTTYGANFKKIEGQVTAIANFDLTDSSNHLYIELLDGKTGNWLSNVVVDSDGSYSILLGDTINENGYILRVSLEHWEYLDWENSYWKDFYLDFTTGSTYELKDESEVRWIETRDEASGQFYWLPNVQPLVITDTTALNIDLTSYQAPVTYKVIGRLTGLPDSAKWVNINLYDPISYIGKSVELKSDNSFELKDLKAGRYIMNISYSDESNGYRYFDYLVVDDNGDFSSGASLKDSMDVRWVPFDSNGVVISQSAIDVVGFDWSSVAYWAPEETTTQKTLFVLTSDVDLGEISIPQPVPPSTLFVSLTGVDANKNVDFNLFVPNEPIGRWESNISLANGDVSITISELKARDDYQLQVWVDGVEYWYNGTGTLTSSHYDGAGFTIAQGATKSLVNLIVPNDKSTITGTLALGTDYSNKSVDVYLWQTVSPYNYAWESFRADANGNVDVSLAVKNGLDYIMEVYNPETWNGFTVDMGTASSGDESLILAQSSWEEGSDGMWKPKDTVLIDVDADLALGTLNPPALKIVTFTLSGLATNSDGNIREDVWISLEDSTNQVWFGGGNSDWSDWRNPTFSNTISMKVPDTVSDCYIYLYTMEHESGFVDANGNDNGHDAMTTTIDFSNSGSAKVTWDSNNADTLAISNETNVTLVLKSTDDYKSIIGSVILGDGDIEAGWMCATSQTDFTGNCGEVDANGTYVISGLSPSDDEVYSVQYWASTGETFNVEATWSDSSNDLTVDMDIASATLIDIIGTVTDSDVTSAPVETVLLDVNGTNWKVLDAHALTLDTNGVAVDFSFTGLAPVVTGHHYEIAVANRDMNMTTGVTSYIVKGAIQSDGSATTTDTISSDETITITFN